MSDLINFSSASSFLKIHSYDFSQSASGTLSKGNRATLITMRLAALVFTAGLFPLACYLIWGRRKVTIMKEMFRNSIIATGSNKAQEKPCNKILNGLFLGSSEAFIGTTHQPCYDHPNGQPIKKETSNPKKFQTIVTVCPLNCIAGDYPDFPTTGLKEILTESFKTHGISWRYIGKILEDSDNDWTSLVHDCTFPESELAETDLKGMTKEKLEKVQQEKREKISQVAADQLFERIFQDLDQAVFYGKKTLVHCQAGRSRSASILAAYLINRFQVSSDEAVAFLQSQRPCVSTKFKAKLDEYALALQAVK